MKILRSLKRHILRLKTGDIPSVAKYIHAYQEATMPERELGLRAGNEWDDYTASIVDEFREAPMSFLRQPVISRTVHPNQQQLARAYLDELSGNPFSRTSILPRLHDLPVGDPYLCAFFPFASPMSIQHAYYHFLMMEHMNLFLPTSEVRHILEIGGGYGNFCRLTCTFGYTGRYVIADLPEMHGIQRHFLGHSLPEKRIKEQIEFRSLKDAEILPSHGPSLLMATFSLSEMPLDTRRLLEPDYKHFDYIFIAYNRAFGDVDNCEYFEQLANKLKENFNVRVIKDRHRTAWFLLCERIY